MDPACISALADVFMAVAAIIALYFTYKSVRLASDNIESATRPVITPYIEKIESNPGAYFFVIKNFGTSTARITDFKTHLEGFDDIKVDMPPLQQLSMRRTYDPFKTIVGTEFPPGFKLYTSLALNAVEGTADNSARRGQQQCILEVNISYVSDTKKNYSESYHINLASSIYLNHDRHEDDLLYKADDPSASIASTLRRLEERLL